MKKHILIIFLSFSTASFAQTWTTIANLPSGRHHPISFSVNGTGYAVTGTASNNFPTNTVYSYNPTTNAWATQTAFPGLARSFGIGAVADNGLAYVGFGATRTQYLNDMWSFNDSTGTWTQLASCACSGRRHPAMVAIGDRIYVGLGDDATGDRNDWWMYNINANTWTQIGSLPGLARHHPFMFNAGGEVFAGFGHGGPVVYRDWYKLDTALNTWTAMSQFPGQARVAGTQFNSNGYGYVLSGDGSNHGFMVTGEMWQYDPANDSWAAQTPHPGRSRWAPGSFVINNDVYFFGGLDRFSSTYPTTAYKFPLPNATSVAETKANLSNTKVYPNPTSDVLFWQSDKNINSVRVYNSVGQLLMEENTSNSKINVHNLNSGFYFIQLLENNQLIHNSKVLIQH